MRNNFSKYDDEFKKSFVSMYQNGKTQTQLVREYGISHSAISSWIKLFPEVKIDDQTVMIAKQIKELQKSNALLDNIKKSDCHINASLKQRLEAVHKLRHEHKIKTLCRVLNVNRSSYYKHFNSPVSKRELENQALRTKILRLYNTSDKRLGVKKMRQRLKAEYGVNIRAGRVYCLIKSMQLPKMSTHRNIRRAKNFNSNKNAENILERRFNPPTPNMVWVSDITVIHTVKDLFYLCVIIDLFARKVIAWSVTSTQSTKFVTGLVLKAWNLRKNPKSVIFHSDRGIQYTSKEFRQLLDRKLALGSLFQAQTVLMIMQPAEAFFKFLKKEEVNRRRFSQIEEVKESLFSYIEGYS